MLLKLLAAAGAATLLAGPVLAQPAPSSSPSANGPDAAASSSAAAPTPDASAGASVTGSAGATAPSTTGYDVGAPQVDQATGAQVVTNGPVPDTRQNRSLYGPPDSHAGRRTRAAGN